MVVIKNCEPELSNILAQLFNKCLKESSFPDYWKVSSVVLAFKNVGGKVSKVFEKLVNNRIVDHMEKRGLFSDFQYGFRSSGSTKAFNRSIYPRLLTGFGMLVFFTNLSQEISGQIFGLISSFLRNRQLRVILDRKSSQEYPVNAGVPQGSISPTLFLLYISDLPDNVICDIAIYVDDTTLYSKCDQASDLWQQLELASELESDLRDTVDWGKK